MEIDKCVEKLQLFCEKLEEQSEKLATALGEDDKEATVNILDKDPSLYSQSEECYQDLKQLNVKLTLVKSETVDQDKAGTI